MRAAGRTPMGHIPFSGDAGLCMSAGGKGDGDHGCFRPDVAAASVVVLPPRMVRGIQHKMLGAMPRIVAAFSPAIEGLDVRVGEEVLRADSADEWRTCILDSLLNESRRRSVAHAARARVVADYSWNSRMAPLVSICDRLAVTSETQGMPLHGGAGQKSVGSANELAGPVGGTT